MEKVYSVEDMQNILRQNEEQWSKQMAVREVVQGHKDGSYIALNITRIEQRPDGIRVYVV